MKYDNVPFDIDNNKIYYTDFGRFFTYWYYDFVNGNDKSYVCLEDKEFYIKTKEIAAKYNDNIWLLIDKLKLQVFEEWNYEPHMAKYKVTIKIDAVDKVIGNLAINKRNGEIENVGYCYNTISHNIWFNPAIINGVAMNVIWGPTIKKEIIKLRSVLEKEILLTDDDIIHM